MMDAKRAKLEKEKAVRASETEDEKEERLDKRNARDRARRAAETEQQKAERLRKRRERDRARGEAAGKQQKATRPSHSQKQVCVSNLKTNRCTSVALQNKRQRLATEPEESRASRLGQLRAYHAERMEVETQEDRECRLKRVSCLQQMRLRMETDQERSIRLEQSSAFQQHKLSIETEEERQSRLEQMSALQQHRLSTETEEKKAVRLSAARERRQAEVRWDGHLPLLERQHVQARMRGFHQEMATIETPICTTCKECFPGMKVNAKKSECQRCARDKHVPKLFSADNNMHPGEVPPELQVMIY